MHLLIIENVDFLFQAKFVLIWNTFFLGITKYFITKRNNIIVQNNYHLENVKKNETEYKFKKKTQKICIEKCKFCSQTHRIGSIFILNLTEFNKLKQHCVNTQRARRIFNKEDQQNIQHDRRFSFLLNM